MSLAYVHEQQEHGTGWLSGDTAAAAALLQSVTSAPTSVLIGVRTAEQLVAAHA